MPLLPRLAFGTIQQGADPQTILVALLNTLRRGGVQTQCFSSQACLPGQWIAKAVTGLPGRYLDSWLMSPEICCNLVHRSTGGADLAAVVGAFDPTLSCRRVGGSLDTLCDWLGLPRLAVVDVARIDQHGLPERPNADAVLLDRTSRHRSPAGMVTDIETIWGLPVLGALGNVDIARRDLSCLAPGSEIPRDLLDTLCTDFRNHWRPDRFASFLEGHRGVPLHEADSIHELPSYRPTIAVAYDKAFFGYFPSTLDQLEMLGAQVVDFSPLHDESLPPGTDIVYFGCGRPEAFASELSENHCMKSALRSHVACGGRIYGEVGGAAYLSQSIEMPSGEMRRMCGILPAIAKFGSDRASPEPIEITVSQGNWLAPQGTVLRGYRSSRWQFQTLGCRLDASQKSCCHPSLIGCNRVVGSLIHFHFAAFPEIFRSFFRPTPRSTPLSDPWQAAT